MIKRQLCCSVTNMSCCCTNFSFSNVFKICRLVWIFHNTHVKLKRTFNYPKNSAWAFENRRIFIFHQNHLDINSRSNWSWIQQEYPEYCLHGSAAKFYEPKSLLSTTVFEIILYFTHYSGQSYPIVNVVDLLAFNIWTTCVHDQLTPVMSCGSRVTIFCV
jgi:hypothetical protein